MQKDSWKEKRDRLKSIHMNNIRQTITYRKKHQKERTNYRKNKRRQKQTK